MDARHVAIPRHQLRDLRIARLMPIADQRRQLAIIGEALQLDVGIVLDQRRIGRVEILAGAQISQDVRRQRAERIMPVVQPRAGLCRSKLPSFAY